MSSRPSNLWTLSTARLRIPGHLTLSPSHLSNSSIQPRVQQMINPSLNKHNHRVLSFKSVQLSESSRENSPAWLSPGQELEHYHHPTSPNHYILPPPQGYHYFDFCHHQILVLLFWTWYQWSHIVYIILYLACFTHITFVRFVHIIIFSWVRSLRGGSTLLHCMNIPQFMYPFCSWCLFGFLPIWCSYKPCSDK